MNKKKIATKYDNPIKIGNWVTAFFSLCLLAFQFLPYWRLEEKSVSINGYVWLTWLYQRNAELIGIFKTALGGTFHENYVIVIPIIIFVLAITTIVVCVMKSEISWIATISALTAITGIFGFILNPVLRLNGLWILNVVVSVLLLAASAAVIYLGVKQLKEIARIKAEQGIR